MNRSNRPFFMYDFMCTQNESKIKPWSLCCIQNWTKFKQNPLLLPSPVSAASVTYRISNGLNLAIMKFIRIRSSIKKEREREILCALFDNIFTANGRRYGRAGRWVESIAAKSIVEISKHVESSEKE